MKDRISRVLDLAARTGFECEVYGESIERFQVEVYRGKVETIDRSSDEGMGIRLVTGGRMGYAFTNGTDMESIEFAFEEAKNNAICSTLEDIDVLADDPGDPIPDGPVSFFLDKGNSADKTEKVIEMEQAAMDFDGTIVNTEGAGYSEVSGEVFIASTRGFERSEKRGLCSCSMSAVAKKGSEIRSGWHYCQSPDVRLLDFNATGVESAKRAFSLLDSRPMPTGRYPVIFDGSAFVDIIYFLEQALSGEMVVKGTTVLAGKLGRKIAADILTLTDDPILEGGCFNARFDDEGVARNTYRLIEGGVLSGFLHNSWTARKSGHPNSANAVRGSYKDLPSPGASNLFVQPGDRTLDEMLADTDRGIYIQSVMGMHTADPISGDFSVGIAGLGIEGGKRSGAVSEMTISGNILDLLGGVVEVGREIVFIGTYGAPPVLIEGLSVSGT
ncbi:MAG: TldD/PmbA family protein [Bacteroidales bacterium]|nr:TldD/PmbA family protein [Candidatus Latescibacterota bacterium]